MSSKVLLKCYAAKLMMNQLSSQENRIEVYEELRSIDAICNNCNKRFRSISAISMHLKLTASRHAVNFIQYGSYDNKTGLNKSSNHRLGA